MKVNISRHAQQRFEEQKICPNSVLNEIKKLPHTKNKAKFTLSNGVQVVYADVSESCRFILTVIGVEKLILGYMGIRRDLIL